MRLFPFWYMVSKPAGNALASLSNMAYAGGVDVDAGGLDVLGAIGAVCASSPGALTGDPELVFGLKSSPRATTPVNQLATNQQETQTTITFLAMIMGFLTQECMLSDEGHATGHQSAAYVR